MPNRVKTYMSRPAQYTSSHLLHPRYAKNYAKIRASAYRYAGKTLYRGLTAAVRRRYR